MGNTKSTVVDELVRKRKWIDAMREDIDRREQHLNDEVEKLSIYQFAEYARRTVQIPNERLAM